MTGNHNNNEDNNIIKTKLLMARMVVVVAPLTIITKTAQSHRILHTPNW